MENIENCVATYGCFKNEELAREWFLRNIMTYSVSLGGNSMKYMQCHFNKETFGHQHYEYPWKWIEPLTIKDNVQICDISHCSHIPWFGEKNKSKHYLYSWDEKCKQIVNKLRVSETFQIVENYFENEKFMDKIDGRTCYLKDYIKKTDEETWKKLLGFYTYFEGNTLKCNLIVSKEQVLNNGIILFIKDRSWYEENCKIFDCLEQNNKLITNPSEDLDKLNHYGKLISLYKEKLNVVNEMIEYHINKSNRDKVISLRKELEDINYKIITYTEIYDTIIGVGTLNIRKNISEFLSNQVMEDKIQNIIK